MPGTTPRLRVVIGTQRADFTELRFVQRERLRLPAVERCFRARARRSDAAFRNLREFKKS
jgi:hypothetical protein